MTVIHIGNNIYIGWKSSGDDRSQIPLIENAIYFDAETGIFSRYYLGSWRTSSYGAKSDQLFSSIITSITKTNIGTTYINVFPTIYEGAPIPLDTSGFSKLGIVLLWNKNGGNGTHSVRLVNAVDSSQVLISGDVITGRNKNYDITIPNTFINFRGELLLQAKSTSANDSPIFDGLWIYLIR